MSSKNTPRCRSHRLWQICAYAILAPIAFSLVLPTSLHGDELPRLKYNHPGLVVDLGVGLWSWPLPMDYDDDGDLDLVVMCPDVPFSGTYFFENTGRMADGDSSMPVFQPPVRIADAQRNVQMSVVGPESFLCSPGRHFRDFRAHQFSNHEPIDIKMDDVHQSSRIRANQWKMCDWNGDGNLDVMIGVGDWEDYGWDNAFNERGEWERGPLHGYVYYVENQGTSENPSYAAAQPLMAGAERLDVFGMPSPNFADFDGDGDLDLICGEFLDGFTYFQNVGSSREPKLTDGIRLTDGSKPLAMDLQMIVPVVIDWDRDGDCDLIVGDEDGRVAFVEHMGLDEHSIPRFQQPRYFLQEADEVKFGALVTPVSCDWDGDGDDDLICGNTAGYIGFIENLDGGNPPRWAAPRRLEADGETIRIQAGPNGSIQGPCEAKWGYTTLDVADWDHDGRLDLVVNSIWGQVVWYPNIGSATDPRLDGSQNVQVDWPESAPFPAWNWWRPDAQQLATQWRTTPLVTDWNDDGLNDLLMLDHEGYLAFYERFESAKGLLLRPGERIFQADGPAAFDSRHRVVEGHSGPLRLNAGSAGASGRRKLCLTDWDGDGRTDLLVNSTSIDWMRNIADDAETVTLRQEGPVTDHRLAGHTTSPTIVDWNGDGVPDLVIGAEDGFLYYLER